MSAFGPFYTPAPQQDLNWLNAIDLVTLQGMATQAQAAYTALMTGSQARVVVDQNGERVEFTATNRQNLLGFINAINAAIFAKQNPGPKVRGPLRMLF